MDLARIRCSGPGRGPAGTIGVRPHRHSRPGALGNHDDADLSAHALALGLERFVSVDAGFVPALEAANNQGAAVVAAHPYSGADPSPRRPTCRIWRERRSLRELIHRYELFNRRETFAWIAEDELPPVATGDVHHAERLAPWKTLIPSERDPAAVVSYLRSPARVLLAPFASQHGSELPLAA